MADKIPQWMKDLDAIADGHHVPRPTKVTYSVWLDVYSLGSRNVQITTSKGPDYAAKQAQRRYRLFGSSVTDVTSKDWSR